MKNNLSFVSIIIPCRNEEKFIGKCLDSIIANDYPRDRLEIFVIDGMSKDGTRKIIEQYIKQYSFIKFLDNPKKIAPVAQNIGIKNAKGEIIIIMDAHSTYEKDYISKCLEYLNKYNADNVGGIIITVPRNNSLSAKAIALVLSHPFGVGNSHFRIGSKKPRWVESVPFGCYKKDIFKKIGYYNEKLASTYDRDFNLRLRKAGGKILLIPDIISYYYVRSNLKDFIKHDFRNGSAVIYSLKFGVKIFSWRHLTPLVFVGSFLGSLILGLFFFWAKILFILILGSYAFLNLFFSTKTSLKEDLRYFLILPIIFTIHHFVYGLGSIWGLIKLLIPTKKKQ